MTQEIHQDNHIVTIDTLRAGIGRLVVSCAQVEEALIDQRQLLSPEAAPPACTSGEAALAGWHQQAMAAAADNLSLQAAITQLHRRLALAFEMRDLICHSLRGYVACLHPSHGAAHLTVAAAVGEAETGEAEPGTRIIEWRELADQLDWLGQAGHSIRFLGQTARQAAMLADPANTAQIAAAESYPRPANSTARHHTGPSSP